MRVEYDTIRWCDVVGQLIKLEDFTDTLVTLDLHRGSDRDGREECGRLLTVEMDG